MSRKMKLSDIKIKPSFEATTPKDGKLDACRNNYLKNRWQDRYIVISHDGELIDGYIMYLILKELGVYEAEVKISEKRRRCWSRRNKEGFRNPKYRSQLTTYIYGVHSSIKCGYTKEFVWRVPNSWDGWADDLLPGDVIYADTKWGTAPVVISRIEWLSRCPVYFRVRKVIGKAKRREGRMYAAHH